MSGQAARRAACCLCIFLVGGCGLTRAHRLADGRYWLHFHFTYIPQSDPVANQTVASDVVRQGDTVTMADPDGKAFPMSGRLNGNDFTLHRDHAGETFDLVGELVSDNHIAGDIGTVEGDGTFASAGTWRLVPAEE